MELRIKEGVRAHSMIKLIFMHQPPKNKSGRIFLLHPSDELRFPYEQAFEKMGMELNTFSSFEALMLAANKITPRIVIMDLDVLQRPTHDVLEQIRANFATSDVIGLSSSDSAQMALQCIRSGFADFLLKPTSPEELIWTVRKSIQKYELYEKLGSPNAELVRAITQISGCTTAPLVQINATEFVYRFLEAKGCAWVNLDNDKVHCSLPKGLSSRKMRKLLPREERWQKSLPPKITVNPKSGKRKVFLPCQDGRSGIFAWGVQKRPTRRQFAIAQLVMEHADLTLFSIQKFIEIKHQTFVDDLTGLYNSRYLKFAIHNAIIKCKTPGESFSLLFIDIDHFKKVNDTNNHLVGSEFLVAIGKTIRHSVRNVDPVFRYGGDEFVVILNGSDINGAMEIAERIRKHIERRLFVIQGLRMHTTVSIGVASYPEHTSDPEILIKLADEAMFSAKKGSRNSVRIAVGLESLSLKKQEA